MTEVTVNIHGVVKTDFLCNAGFEFQYRNLLSVRMEIWHCARSRFRIVMVLFFSEMVNGLAE